MYSTVRSNNCAPYYTVLLNVKPTVTALEDIVALKLETMYIFHWVTTTIGEFLETCKEEVNLHLRYVYIPNTPSLSTGRS